MTDADAANTALRDALRRGDGGALLDALLSAARSAGASDVHLEPGAARLRIDGRLETIAAQGLGAALVDAAAAEALRRCGASPEGASRGRAPAGASGGRPAPWSGPLPIEGLDALACGVPTARGWRLVIRLRPLERRPMALDALPLAPDAIRSVEATLASGRGLILVSGPTGSGVTEALYALLAAAPAGVKITIEDPVEYDLPGVAQAAVDPRRGFFAADGVRAALRQDADAVLVGEIRDRQTASGALGAGLASAPLVLAGLRAPSAPAAVQTLLDLELDPSLIAASLRGVIAVRLVRRLCGCAAPAPGGGEGGRVPVGCERCGGRGYRGRIGVLDWLPIGGPEAAAIAAGRAPGRCGLRRRGLALAAAGATSREEVSRATPG